MRSRYRKPPEEKNEERKTIFLPPRKKKEENDDTEKKKKADDDVNTGLLTAIKGIDSKLDLLIKRDEEVHKQLDKKTDKVEEEKTADETKKEKDENT